MRPARHRRLQASGPIPDKNPARRPSGLPRAEWRAAGPGIGGRPRACGGAQSAANRAVMGWIAGASDMERGLLAPGEGPQMSGRCPFFGRSSTRGGRPPPKRRITRRPSASGGVSCGLCPDGSGGGGEGSGLCPLPSMSAASGSAGGGAAERAGEGAPACARFCSCQRRVDPRGAARQSGRGRGFRTCGMPRGTARPLGF